jgi:hypothetical protein
MTVTNDFALDDGDPQFSSERMLLLFARHKRMGALHYRLVVAIAYFQKKFGRYAVASVEEISVIMGESMETVLRISEEFKEMSV